jgi:hypothetical protein
VGEKLFLIRPAFGNEPCHGHQGIVCDALAAIGCPVQDDFTQPSAYLDASKSRLPF